MMSKHQVQAQAQAQAQEDGTQIWLRSVQSRVSRDYREIEQPTNGIREWLFASR